MQAMLFRSGGIQFQNVARLISAPFPLLIQKEI